MTIECVNPCIQFARHIAAQLDELVDEILEHLLPATPNVRLSILERVGFEFFETDLPFLNLGADAAIKRAVALLHKAIQATIFDNGGGNLESPRKGIHAADVAMEEVDRL